jgi:hypothetical protein
MARTVRIATLVSALLIATSLGVSADASLGSTPLTPGCASGSASQAARAVVHPDAELVSTGTVAGFESALVLEPLIYPGVRHRLIRAGGLWCEASALNLAWGLADRPADAAAIATAFARLGGVVHFDGVKVLRSTQIAPGLFSVDTHAFTNGITARWTIGVDGQGVRTARWIATGLGVEPFEAEWEGIGATPGQTRTYTRSPAGLLGQVEPLLPELDAVPEPVTEGRGTDGFTIRISTGGSQYSPNAGQDTGVHDVDFTRRVRDVAVENYNEFLQWGFVKQWDSEVGTIFIDDSSAASCWACVTRSATFNIHITNRIEQILLALGWEYDDQRDALSTVIGHEMYHNWQNAYGKPNFNDRTSSFSEGTARMQETAHEYSAVSHQPNSLVYSTGRQVPANAVSLAANSCNGWDGSDIHAAFANGPFTGKSYNACYFWLTWFGTHGTDGQVGLLTAMKTHQSNGAEWADNRGAIQEVVGGSILPDLVAFAAAALTGDGYTWGDIAGKQQPLDWSVYLDRWTVATLAPGGSATATLRDGGVMARKVEVGGYPSLTSSRAETGLAQIRSDGAGTTYEVLEPGACIEPPAEGELIWLVAAYPGAGTASAQIGHQPLDPGLTACPEEDEGE